MRVGIQEAVRLMEAGQRVGAERVLFSLLEEHPENAQANYLMASLCDQSDRERRAVPFYQRALAAVEDLPVEDAAGAYLGLGSTHRALGEHEESRRVLLEGLQRFPDDRALSTFLALTLHNLGEHREAVSTLLKNLVETTGDPSIQLYARALAFYADHLDETFR